MTAAGTTSTKSKKDPITRKNPLPVRELQAIKPKEHHWYSKAAFWTIQENPFPAHVWTSGRLTEQESTITPDTISGDINIPTGTADSVWKLSNRDLILDERLTSMSKYRCRLDRACIRRNYIFLIKAPMKRTHCSIR